MRGLLEDVLAGEAPVAPAEVTHLVKSLEIERSGHRVFFCEFSHSALLSAIAYGFQELAVVARPVLAEVLQDVCKGRLWHRNLQQVVAHGNLPDVRLVRISSRNRTYHAVIGSRFTTERERLLADALVNHTVGEHGLRGDAEDEGTEASVAVGLALLPHCYDAG